MRVLILAYDFPPSVRVGGLRPYSWFRYLGEFGVEPIVITRQWSATYGDDRDYVAPSASSEAIVDENHLGTIIRTPYRPNMSHRLLLRGGPSRFRLARKAISAWHEVAQYYLTVGPRKELYRAARDYLREHRVDVIVATGEPFVLFRYATRLSAEFGVPWIADYRDAWSHDRGGSVKRLSRALELGLERKFTRTASAITTVCEFFQHLLVSLHGKKPVHVVPNGYDPEVVSRARPVEQSHDRLTIGFAGSIYAWDPVRSFLSVCDRIVRQEGPKLELRLVLVNERSEIAAMLATEFPALATCVRILKPVPNDQVAIELSSANALLLFNAYALVGTKVYEYVALRRRILLCFSEDPEALRIKEEIYHLPTAGMEGHRPLERLIAETNAGVVVKDSEQLERVLRDMLVEFEQTGAISCSVTDTEALSRRTQAERMSGILKELASCAE